MDIVRKSVIIAVIVALFATAVMYSKPEGPVIILPEPVIVETLPIDKPKNKQITFISETPEIIEEEIEEPVIPESYGLLNQTQNIFNQSILGGYYLNSEPNTSVAARTLDGHILQPGSVFSFNETVGERTPEKRVCRRLCN